ncbi:hypothetical protein ACFWYW_46915 [Nonomuraea sp. NPDC059023]|uniref:hypothetical protein n=1 Tax=unclassified Nonomuraea TaxID=2593643 RepID=UPI00369A24F1
MAHPNEPVTTLQALIADTIRSTARAEWDEVPDGNVCEIYPDDTAARIIEALTSPKGHEHAHHA